MVNMVSYRGGGAGNVNKGDYNLKLNYVVSLLKPHQSPILILLQWILFNLDCVNPKPAIWKSKTS